MVDVYITSSTFMSLLRTHLGCLAGTDTVMNIERVQ
jgi:hypothetical protein